jgi:SAM-dependent methyltransferase/uncharacterized protein YbaR (Trm112 family)
LGILARVDPSLPERLPLVCPACRRRGEDGWHLHTLSLAEALRGDDVLGVIEGTLSCGNATCGRRYPILDGIPIIAHPLAAAVLVEPPSAPSLASLLVADEPDDAPLPRLYEHLSIYLDSQWGDRTVPAPIASVPDAGWGYGELMALLGRWCAEPVERAVELGTGLGRALVALNAQIVVGLDRHLAGLRRARELLRGRRLPYARRELGRHYVTAEVTGIEHRGALVCGDALEPPFAPASCDRVVALNLLDVVNDPPRLIDVAAGLTAPGGDLILAAPFAWQSGTVDEDKRLAGADPRAALAARLAEHGVEVVETAEVRWTLRRDARACVVYLVHALRGRKPR